MINERGSMNLTKMDDKLLFLKGTICMTFLITNHLFFIAYEQSTETVQNTNLEYSIDRFINMSWFWRFQAEHDQIIKCLIRLTGHKSICFTRHNHLTYNQFTRPGQLHGLVGSHDLSPINWPGLVLGFRPSEAALPIFLSLIQM